jgi:hypothetical protein
MSSNKGTTSSCLAVFLCFGEKTKIGCAASIDSAARCLDLSPKNLEQLLESSDERLERYSRTRASPKLNTFPLSSCELLARFRFNNPLLTDDVDTEAFTFTGVWMDEVPANVKFANYTGCGKIIFSSTIKMIKAYKNKYTVIFTLLNLNCVCVQECFQSIFHSKKNDSSIQNYKTYGSIFIQAEFVN